MEIETKKIIKDTNECINNCSDDNHYKYEYNGKCYSICSNGYFYDDNNNTKCKCELEKCFTCPTVKQLCTKCNDNYYPLENDLLNFGEYFNCYNETPIGYYLDINNSLYKNAMIHVKLVI